MEKSLYSGHHDPILTALGIQQARETGEFLKRSLLQIETNEGRKFDEIRIKASPFERTITTAAQVARGVGVNYIHLDYAWVEALYSKQLVEWGYSEDPIPELEARQIGLSGLAIKHQGLTFTADEE